MDLFYKKLLKDYKMIKNIFWKLLSKMEINQNMFLKDYKMIKIVF
jgi:hypothetical protein